MAILRRHADEEGVPLDDPDGALLGVHDGDGHGVGLGVKPTIDLGPCDLRQYSGRIRSNVQEQCHYKPA
jgi:hypothetical protein